MIVNSIDLLKKACGYCTFLKEILTDGGPTPADRFFEIETTEKRQLAEKIAENNLELALKDHVRKPFMMVGLVEDSCVSILEKKGQFAVLAGKCA